MGNGPSIVPPGGEQHVLVTGGAGYIGSHTCKALARAGFVPVSYDNLENGHRWAVRWGPLEVGDIRDRERLDQLIRRYAPVATLHFAGYVSVDESVQFPEKYRDNNVAGTRVLLEALCAAGVRKFVFSSSCAVFGAPQILPMPEEHPIRPVNPYGVTKAESEQLLRDLAASQSLSATALRYFNAAGADPDGELGEAHDPETHLIPIVLDVALGRRPSLKIYGDRYDTPDGTCVRDYVHVTDLADAHVLALRRLLQAPPEFAAFNLGNSQGFSVRQVLDAARRITGRAIAADVAPPRPGDEAVLVSDSRKARTQLGWQPRLAALDVQIAHAWAWHQRHFGGT